MQKDLKEALIGGKLTLLPRAQKRFTLEENRVKELALPFSFIATHVPHLGKGV